MNRLLLRLHTLQWRLTLSYVLVTVVSILALQGLILTAVYVFFLNSPNLTQQLASSLEEQVAPTIVPYLLQAKPSPTALTAKLQLLVKQNNSTSLNSFFQGNTGGVPTLMVLDRQNNIIAEIHNAHSPAPATILQTIDASVAFQQIQQGKGTYTHQLPNGTTLQALPILNIDGSVLGVVADTIDIPFARANYLSLAVRTFLPSSLALTLGSAVIGSLFGIFTSRGIVRRMKTITKAADAWSKGDFAVQVQDASVDELGQLAQRLNGMAEQVQTLLATRQELAVVEERQRFARDLHDSVKQQVFATSMQVAAARATITTNPEATQRHLSEAAQLIGQAQRELTGLIGELRPAALGDQGLVAALQTLGNDWSRQNNITFTLRAQDAQPIPFETEQTLFRVAQEALANIARHSGASQAEIHLAWEGHLLKVRIQDNGHGFDTSAMKNKGVGLQSMVERIEALGGLVAVASTAAGTRIELQVPLSV